MFLALTMVLPLAGCGSGQSGSSEETPVTESEPEAKILLIEVNGETLEAELEDNEAAQALTDLAGDDGLKLELKEYGGFEKVGPLPQGLPASDEQIDTSPGDIVLYQGDQISLFYGENSWSYTKLGHIKNADAEQLQEILGDGDVQITLKQ